MMMMRRTIRFGLFLFVQIALASGVPYLQTIQNLSIYVPGDDITLVCCSQYALNHQTFEFYRQDSLIHSIAHDKNCTNHMFKITRRQDIGPYYCAYKALENGTYVQSNMSHPITFQFADTPLPPTITLVPLFSVYTAKESLHLACAPPDGTAAEGIQIYKGEKKIHEEVTLESTYEISASDKDAPGKYYCKYWVEMNGRRISSSPSEHVTVNVTNVPLAPSLSLREEHSKYIEGEAVTLTCSFPLDFTVREVQFYRNGELFPITNIRRRNAFAMATLNATATANFTCQYTAEIRGRTIASDSSNEVTISTTGVPYLQTIQNLSIYVPGDDITLVCCSQYHMSHQIFKFYRKDSLIHSIAHDKNCTSHMFKITTQQEIGPYYCAYKALEDGNYVKSNMSHPITLQFADTPLPPTIKLVPLFSVYTAKESLHLACAPPDGTAAEGIQIYKGEKKIHEEVTLESTYEISASDKDAPGKYYCKYWLEMNGRRISSSPSEHVTVNVTNVPLAPSLSLREEHSKYIEGEAVTLTCSFPLDFTVREVQFYRNGELFPITNIRRRNAFAMATLNATATANFTCQYTAEIRGRTIASDSSNEVTISTTDIPQAPSIILNPKLPVYIKGETVSITCSLPEESTLVSIQYIKDNQEIHKSETPKTMPTYVLSNLSLENTGQYKCQYLVKTSGRQISSHPSVPISIIVEDPPVTPVLKLAPALEIYVVGESLVLTCSGLVNARHNIYKDGQLLQNDFSHLIPSIQLYHNGNYTCAYSFDNKGRQMESARSQAVNIYVIDPLPTPTLTLGGPIEKVEEGFEVTLNCSAPDEDLLRTFYYFSTTEANGVTNLTGFSASLELKLGPISHISYICEYEQELRGRKIRSRRSQTLSIQLSEASAMSPPVIAGIIGAISLLLCFILTLFFYMKSKRYNRLNHFRFSQYWKEKRTPKKSHTPQPLCPLKEIEETNQVLDISGKDYCKIVSRNPSCLSIATQKEADALDGAMTFSTFHSKNVSEGESAWNSSAL